jgi:hypothetical protein
MELHLVLKKAVEYNDEFNYFTEGGKPVKAFKNIDNARAAMADMEKEARKEAEEEDLEFEDGEIPELYYLETIQVEDENVADYAAQRQIIKEAKSRMVAIAQDLFAAKSREVFEQHPKLQGIRITAYTPYWCDGGPCEYGVSDPYIRFEGADTEELSHRSFVDDDGYFEIYDYEGCDEKYPDGAVEACKAAEALVKSISEEDFKSLFGDHVQVTITRDGVETEEYEHD